MASTAGSPTPTSGPASRGVDPVRASWVALGALGGLALAQPIACDRVAGGGDSGGPAAATVEDLLAQVGPGVVVPAVEDVQATLPGLRSAVEAWQAAVGTADEDAAREAAQAAWRSTFVSWQRVEVMQIGPAGSSLTTVGGQDLRDEIYSWPTVNACRVDQETVEAAWDEDGFFDENLVNVYGLDALEYLLFAGPENDCPGQVEINTDGTWAALGEEGVASSRSAYALAVVDRLDEDLATLHGAWTDGWSGTLATGADPYAGTQDALNAVYDGLFYVETGTKDRKLAQPLGLRDCADDLCPDDVESPHGDAGVDALTANLEGFRALYLGGDGAGFDDLLVDLGHGDLDTTIQADLDAALAAAAAVEGPLDQAVTDRTAQVEALHAAVKALADHMKGDVATLLSLEIPSEAAGDND